MARDGTSRGEEGGTAPIVHSVGLSELQMAGAAFGLTTAFGRYEDKEQLSSITRDPRTKAAVRANDEALVLRDAFGVRSSRWKRRRAEASVVVVDSTAPAYRATYPAYQSSWQFSWSGGAAPGVHNVEPTKALLDMSAERLKASEGFSESWAKRYHNKGERVRLLAARMWYGSQSGWLSWLREGFATLALREVGPYIHAYPEIVAEVTTKTDATGKVTVTEKPVTWRDVVRRRMASVRHAATPSPAPLGWVGDAVPGFSATWSVPTLRRKSIIGRAGVDFAAQSIDKTIVPQFVLPPGAGAPLRVFLANEFDLVSQLWDTGDPVLGEVFVSRANTVAGVWQDIMCCVAHGARCALDSGDPAHAARGFRAILCPGLAEPEMKSACPEWASLPSRDLAIGSWTYFLGRVVKYRWAGGPVSSTFSMTARDLHAMYRHLAYARCVGCLPWGSTVDDVGNSGGGSYLTGSHWTVRVVAAVGLVTERAGCYGVAETFLPGAGSLERGLRWMGVRLAKGFDLVTGAVHGLSRNLTKVGEQAVAMHEAGVAAFNDAYALVDGVFVGWCYRYNVDLTHLSDPDAFPDFFEVGTRKCWGLVGELDGAQNEWGVFGTSPDIPSNVNRYGGYDLAGMTQSQFATVFVANLESAEGLDVNMRNGWGAVASVPVQLYGEATHRASGGWSSFSAPLYFWRLREGELSGDLEVPVRWGSRVGWFVDSDLEGSTRVRSVLQDFM